MKTIQQIIREMDSKKMENAFFCEHPIELFDINGLDGKPLGEVKKRISTRFQNYIERLRTMKIEKEDDEEWILFAYKSQEFDGSLGRVVGLLKAGELLEKDNLSEIETYAYEFTEQKKALGFFVADTKLTQDNLMDVVVDFLYEVSFFGYEQEGLKEELDILEEAIKEIDEHPEQCKTFDLEDIRKKYGLPEEEEYPEEQEKERKFYEAAMDYTKYCKCVEVERIKKAVLEENKVNR